MTDILKFERDQDLLSTILNDMSLMRKELNEDIKRLGVEVTELRTHNANATGKLDEASSKIRKTVEQTTLESQPILTKSIKESLAEHFSGMKQEVSALSKKLEGAYRERESSLTTKGVLITVSFCLGSILTGAVLWYFFPQHISVNQTLTEWQMKGLRDGALFRHAFKKLPKKEQQSLEKKMWDSYDDWFKEFLDHRK